MYTRFMFTYLCIFVIVFLLEGVSTLEFSWLKPGHGQVFLSIQTIRLFTRARIFCPIEYSSDLAVFKNVEDFDAVRNSDIVINASAREDSGEMENENQVESSKSTSGCPGNAKSNENSNNDTNNFDDSDPITNPNVGKKGMQNMEEK